MQVNTFDVIQRRSKICLFKLGKIWVFKHFLDDKAIFKTFGARNKAFKALE